MEVIITHDGADHSVGYAVAQGNDGSDVVTFTLPRYRGSLDLSTLTPALLMMGEDGEPDEIRVAEDGLLTMEAGDDTVTLTWTLSGRVTAQSGTLCYQLVFRNADGDKRFSTYPAKLTVVSSLDAEELLVSSYPTYLWQWEQEMAALKQQAEDTYASLSYILLAAEKNAVAFTEAPDTITAPGSYYGTAENWEIGEDTLSGSYFLTVERSGSSDDETYTLTQTVLFITRGKVYTRYLESDAAAWSDFTELSYTPPTALTRTKSENGFLLNVYSDGEVLQRGRTGDTTAQTFEATTVGDAGDVSFDPNDSTVSMTIGELSGFGNGILITWSGESDTRCFPALRVRRDTPDGYGAVGFDICNRRQSEFSFTLEVYLCASGSLGNSRYSVGKVSVTVPNDGEVHHLRYTWEDLGAEEAPYLPDDNAALCCKISWNNATDAATDGDSVWLSSFDCYLGEV